MRIFTIFILALTWSITAFSQKSADKENNEILYICSYNADTRYSDEFTQDFWKEYTQKGGSRRMDIETMNCSSLDSHKEWVAKMKEVLTRHPNPAMIILYGPEAWVSYTSLEDEKWKTVPLCLISSQRWGARMDFEDLPSIRRTEENRGLLVDYLELLNGWNVKMCYYYEYAISEDVQILKRLNPKINTIAIVGDNSFSGYSMLRFAAAEIDKNFPEMKVVEIDGSREDAESANEIMRNLPKTSAVLYCIWRYDKRGSVSIYQTNKLLDQVSDIPIMTTTGRGFGEWAIGGSNPQYDWKDGRISPALLAYEMLDQHLDIEPYYYRCPNYYQFDLNIVKRLGYNRELLPEGSILINEMIGIGDLITRYRTEFIIIVSLLVILVIAFAVTIGYSIRVSRMKAELQENEKKLKEDKKMLQQSEEKLIRARDKAEAMDRMKTHFIQNISHEIRTPLNAIKGFSEIILDPTAELDDTVKKDLAQRISHNVDLVSDIVNDILEFSDIESSEYAIKIRPVKCIDICQSVFEIAESHKKANVKFSFSTDANENFTVKTDEKLVRDVLIQLLKNAGKFTDKGAILLRCSVNENPGSVTFSVTDTGPGVPADKAEFIFGRFKKLNDFVQGTGLGLSICRAIATNLKAEVKLDTAYTGGARFVFILPQG